MCRPWTRLTLVSAATLTLAPLPVTTLVAPPSTNAPIILNLYNLMDVYGHIRQVAKRGTVYKAGLPAIDRYLKRARQMNPSSSFTLPEGNIGTSPYISGVLKDNPTITALSTMNPLASTTGSRELDMEQVVFKQHVDGSNPDRFVQAAFPYLGVNIEGMGTYGDDMPYPEDYKLWMSPSGTKIAFIGATAQDVPYKLSPGTTAGLTFTDPIRCINNLVAELKGNGEANVIIAMLDDDMKDSHPRVGEGVDGLMGDDIHVLYKFNHVNSYERFDSASPPLAGITSDSYTDNLGLIRLTIDPVTRQVTGADSILVPTTEVAQCGSNPDTQAIVSQAKSNSKETEKHVVATGYTEAFGRGVSTTSEGATDSGSNRGIEPFLDNSVTGSPRETILTPDGKSIDIGMVMADGLRADLMPNEDDTVTYMWMYEVISFSDELGYVTLGGSGVKDVLEQQWKTDLNSQNSRPMLKLGLSSSVRYTYDPVKPYSQRITSVMIDGELLKTDTMYTVGSVSFPLEGDDPFETLTYGGAATTNGNLDRDSFNAHLDAHSGGRARSVQTEGGLSPREAKSSIGLTLPIEATANGSTVTIPLRGLSFSGGPSITSKVRVSVRGAQTVVEADNSFANACASDAASVITTDGAGQASVGMMVAGAYEGKAIGEIVNVPVTVATDLATVVEAGDDFTIPVTCAGDSAARPSPTPGAGGDATPNAPTSSTPPSPSAKRGGLTRIGAHAEALFGVAVITAIGGAGVPARRHVNHYQNKN